MSEISPIIESHGAGGSVRLTEPADFKPQSRLPFPVVGLGASAGGLEAYMEFLKACPPDTGLAFVLIQHLPPDRDSLAAEILGKQTSMPVSTVEDGQPVEPNHVYVIRPGHTLTLDDGLLRLGKPLADRGHSRPVDDFFRSLAKEQQQRAIAVILSGMGSNGTAGAEAVEAVGGLVIAQDPATAKFPSMPQSLITANLADFILAPAKIPEALVRYAAHPYVAADEIPERLPDDESLAEILSLLRTRTRHDFSGYRKPTILRRIFRRMGLSHVTTLSDYLNLLRPNSSEVGTLADDLLIHVTGFFRDPDAWQALWDKVILPLVDAQAEGAPIRAWVTACATGEEAYSLAMMLLEASEARGKKFDIKVFATDMALRALGHARSGTFPGGIESEVSPERLERFFDREDTMYRVKRHLRELVIFAPQNVLQDPPFSRLDIITCRNLLIYLEPPVQQRVLNLLHFGLREGGALLLGNSESISESEGSFTPLDKKHRLFRRTGPTRHGALDFPQLRLSGKAVTAAPEHTVRFAAIEQTASRLLLNQHTPPAVVVDAQGRIVFFHGETGAFLAQPHGEPSLDLLSQVKDFVRSAVRTALARVMETDRATVVRDGLLETAAGRMRVEVGAQPLERRGDDARHYLVTFRSHPEPAPVVGSSETLTESSLVEELQRVRDELGNTLSDMQASNEEMKASHEEATSINEELQSTNEELETSKEELQSLNEELTTVNSQLQVKMVELENATNDLGSLLTSTDIAVLFLDRGFRIRRFTPAVRDLLDLIPSDMGRPLADLRRKFADPDLPRDLAAVLDRLVPIEHEVRSESGRDYLRRVHPYRTADDRIDGVVVTFVDVTERRLAVAALRESEERLRAVVANLPNGAAFVVDRDLRYTFAAGQALEPAGFQADGMIGKTLAEVHGPEALEHHRTHYRAALNGETFEFEHAIHGRAYITHGVPLRSADGTIFAALAVSYDITDRARAVADLERAQSELRIALSAARMGVWQWDVEANTHARDENLNRLLGLEPVATRTPFPEFLSRIHADDRALVQGAFDTTVQEGQPLNIEFRTVWPDGSTHWLRDQGDIFHTAGTPVVSGACMDITDLKNAEQELMDARDDLEGRVRERTAEVESMEEARRDLLGRIVTAQEEERRRIARELHDRVGQHLAVLNLGLKTARKAAHAAEVNGEIDKLSAVLAETSQEVHRLGTELRPTALDDIGLEAALRQYVEMWSARTGIPVEFSSQSTADDVLPWEVPTTVFRAVQEALTNVLRHAAATRVSVMLDRRADALRAVIEDNGRGFHADNRPRSGGLGLSGMRERISLLRGTLQIESAPGHGTTIYVTIPLAHKTH